MDCVGMKRDVINIESHTTQVFFTQWPFLGSPLEATNYTIFDLVQILHTFGGVNDHVGTTCLRSEAPDLSGFGKVKTVFLSQESRTGLDILSGENLTWLKTRILFKARLFKSRLANPGLKIINQGQIVQKHVNLTLG